VSLEEQEILKEFIVEATEHLADIENQLLVIESAGSEIDKELVNQVFRAVHSVKGAAGFLHLEGISALAHSFENVLNLLRNGTFLPQACDTDVMLRAADALKTLIGELPGQGSVDGRRLIAELETIADRSTDRGAAQGMASALSQAATDSFEETPNESGTEAMSEPWQTAGATAYPAPEKASHPAEPSASGSPTPAAAAANASEANIRVAVTVLDRLMNLAGELVLSRNQLLQTVDQPEHRGLEAAAASLDHVTSKLQEAIMQTRMQPIGNLLGRFPRVVRDLSAKLGKHCELTIEGKEVEVDKSIIEAIGDPLTHLIRNAVDHGLEAPPVRSAAGKRPLGSIRLRAYHRAGKVCVEIADDGGGIDPEKIRRKAVEKEILTEDQARRLSDRESIRLIFHAGFSTAEKLSDVSGRGVGMDVVRSNVEKLGGTVDVESSVGSGTTIRVSLPLTLAIIPSMIVSVGNQRFAIPQANIAELVRLRPQEAEKRIAFVKSGEVLRLRGDLLPLLRLTRVLGMEKADDGDSRRGPVNVIVLETGNLRYGLLVDGISDSEEIVVKPLGRHFKTCTFLAGATILGDGRVALILDVAGIAASANFLGSAEPEEEGDAAHRGDSTQGDRHSILIFRSDPSESFAIPMELVSRIERIRADQIEFVGGRELLIYGGEPLPLLAVEDLVKVKPRPQSPYLHVIVFNTADRDIGLVAPELDDIREVTSQIDNATFRQPGVSGSITIEGRLVRLVDVFEMVERIHPQWVEQSSPAGAEPGTRVLLAEDSHFFRGQLATFLTSAGYEVHEADDGQEAWQILQDAAHSFDLLITDIEMPHMNGFELCERIRRSETLRGLPVLALTSLSSDDNVQRGKECGFNDYQVKMHRDHLLRAVHKLTGGGPTPVKRRAGGRPLQEVRS
jgi:two-component system chemotaxis sensor kinase CheA